MSLIDGISIVAHLLGVELDQPPLIDLSLVCGLQYQLYRLRALIKGI